MANGEKQCECREDWTDGTGICGECGLKREQPQEPSRCPTCGSDNKKVRNRLRARGPSGGGTVNCTDPWHSEASEGREKPRSPDRHTAIDADDFIAEPATPAPGAPADVSSFIVKIPDTSKVCDESVGFICDRCEIAHWLLDRYENCLRLSEQFPPKDTPEWMEDAKFFLAAAQLVGDCKPAASPRSGMGAREFAHKWIAENIPLQFDDVAAGGTTQLTQEQLEQLLEACSGDYATDQVRQATDVHLREVQELQNRVQYLRFGDPTRQSKGAESMSDGGPDNPASGGHSSECPSIPELQAKVAQLRQEAKAATNDLMRISKALNQPGTQLVPIADRAIKAIEKLRQERDALEHNLEIAVESGLKVQEARERAERALREIVHSVGKLAEESGEDWRLKHAELMDAYEAGALAVKSSEEAK